MTKEYAIQEDRIVFIAGEFCVTEHEAVGEKWYNVRPIGSPTYTLGTFNLQKNAELFIRAKLGWPTEEAPHNSECDFDPKTLRLTKDIPAGERFTICDKCYAKIYSKRGGS